MKSRTTSRSIAFVLMLVLVLLCGQLFAQTLVVIPNCGEAGKTKVCATGSGWAEPSPTCFYRFYFDGAQVVFPDQPDGLFGPPARSFTVPAAATAGNHTVTVDLRLSSNNALLQTKSVPFKVVATQKNPFAATAASGNNMNIKFDPTDVCDITPCTKIVYIQVYKQFAIKDDGTETATNDSFWGLPAGRDADFTTNMFVLDRIFGKTEPYYGGNGLLTGGGTGSSTVGSNVGGNTTATMTDGPNQSFYPAGVKGIRVEFETNVFCAAGDDKGRYFGKVTWKWEQNKGSASGTATLIGTSRDAPSANFTSAVTKWTGSTTHPFTLPTPTFPVCP